MVKAIAPNRLAGRSSRNTADNTTDAQHAAAVDHQIPRTQWREHGADAGAQGRSHQAMPGNEQGSPEVRLHHDHG